MEKGNARLNEWVGMKAVYETCEGGVNLLARLIGSTNSDHKPSFTRAASIPTTTAATGCRNAGALAPDCGVSNLMTEGL